MPGRATPSRQPPNASTGAIRPARFTYSRFGKRKGIRCRLEITQWPGMSRQAMGTILPPCQGCFRRFGIVMPDGFLLEIYAFPTPVARVADRCADRAVAGIAAAAVLCEIGHQPVHRRTVGGVDQRIAPRGGTSPGRHASVGSDETRGWSSAGRASRRYARQRALRSRPAPASERYRDGSPARARPRPLWCPFFPYLQNRVNVSVPRIRAAPELPPAPFTTYRLDPP